MIINADDFGMTDGVTRGIAGAMLNGVVATTSAMVSAPESLQRVALHAGRLDGRIGMHLQLTDGVPCCPPAEIPTLVNETGRFQRSWRDLAGLDLNVAEILREWTAQIERLLDLGIRPSHLDTHHNVHRFPQPARAYCELALRYNLPVRTLAPAYTSAVRAQGVRCADLCYTDWSWQELSPEGLLLAAESAFSQAGRHEGVVEIMVHPGYVDDQLLQLSSYSIQRQRELETLCNPFTRELLASHGFTLAATRSDYERC